MMIRSLPPFSSLVTYGGWYQRALKYHGATLWEKALRIWDIMLTVVVLDVLSVGVWLAIAEVCKDTMDDWFGMVMVYTATGGLFLLQGPAVRLCVGLPSAPLRMAVEAPMNVAGCILSCYHWQTLWAYIDTYFDDLTSDFVCLGLGMVSQLF